MFYSLVVLAAVPLQASLNNKKDVRQILRSWDTLLEILIELKAFQI